MKGVGRASVEVYETNAGQINLYGLLNGEAVFWMDFYGREGEAADAFVALARGADPVEEGWELNGLPASEAYADDVADSRLIATVEDGVCSVDHDALCSAGEKFAWRLVSDDAKYVVEDHTTGDIYVCDGKAGLAERLMRDIPEDREEEREAAMALVDRVPRRLPWREYVGDLESVLNISVEVEVEARRGLGEGDRLDPTEIRRDAKAAAAASVAEGSERERRETMTR